MANPFAKAWWNAQDAFKANTDRDKKKRQEAGQPILYQDQQRMAPVQRPVQVNRPTFKPFDNSLTRGLSRGFDQVNMFDNNRTWQQTAPTNQRSVGGIFGAVPKSIVKPFVETGDIVKSGTQLGIANFTGNKQAADNARLNRDTSYQESMFAPAISRTYTRLSEVPVIGDTLAPGKRQANKIIERKLQDTQKLTDIAVDSKVKEISNGIKSGKYDRNKGNQAIQQILEQGKVPTQALDQFYNQRLQSAGFDKNMSAGRIGASTAGDLATVASLAIAPASGASLAKLPIRQAVKTGTTDVLTNSVLGATGTGATAYGQGASLQDSLKAASSGALINTALLGAGYIKPALTGITGKTNRVVTPKNINTSRIAPDKIRVLSELHDSLLPDSKITRTTEMVKTAQEIAKKTGNKDLINAAPEARRAAILDTIDAYEVARGSVSDLSKPRFISSQPVTNTVGAAAERRMVRDNIQSRPIINGSALSGEGAQLPGPRLPKEVQQNLMTKARAKLGIKPMDEVGGAKIGDIPGLNKVAKDPLESLKQEADVKVKRGEFFGGNLADNIDSQDVIKQTPDLANWKVDNKPLRSSDIKVDRENKTITLDLDQIDKMPGDYYTNLDKRLANGIDSITGYSKPDQNLLAKNILSGNKGKQLEAEIVKTMDSIGIKNVEDIRVHGSRVSGISEKTGLPTRPDSDLDVIVVYKSGTKDFNALNDEFSKMQDSLNKGKDYAFDYNGVKVNIIPLTSEAAGNKGVKLTDLYNEATKSKKLFKSLDQEGKVPMDSPLLPLNRAVSKKQSKFAKTIAKSDEISPELQSSVKKANPEYIPLENAEMAKVSKKFVNKGYKKASVEVTSRLETKLGKINGQDVADTIHVIKELDKRGGIENLQKATDLSEKLSQHLTKAGQTIQASSILNNRTPAGMMYGARKFLKNNGIDVTPEIQKQIKSKVDEIAKLPKGEDRLYKIAELQQSISQLVPSTRLEKAVGLWKAGLLTGIKTQTGNTLSGVATNIIKTASDAPAALLDTGFSALGKTKVGKKLGFQGQRSKVFTLRGKGSGAVEGAQKGWKSLKTGIDERNMEASKFDTKRLVFSNKPAGKIAQKYTDTVYGLMGAADRPNYYSNLRNNLYDLAIVDAKNKNLAGALKEAHIKKFVKEPPMSALETANKAAETAIFANDTALSRIAGGVIKKAEDAGPGIGAAAKIAMPFTKVPSSVATRLIDYSPFGAVKTVVSQIQNVKKGGVLDQRALSEGLAQSGVGTGTMFLGMKLKEADLMTGSYPTDEKERELWKLEGKQENSVKVGGKWLSFNYTSPVGQILAIGGKVQEAKETGQGIGGQLATGAAAIPKTVSEQSFLQGVSGLQDAINDPERSGAKFAKSQAASIIPTLSNDIGKATDKYQRQSNSIPEAIKARVPGLNQTLLPKQDSFGAPLPRASSSVDTLLNPFRPSKVRETNPLNSELRRLQDAQFGVMPSTNDKKLIFGSKAKGTEQIVNLTPEQLYDKNNQTGQSIQKIWNGIIKSPEYQKMDDSEKQKTLRNALSDVNAVTRNQFAAKNKPELLDLQKLSKDQTKLAQGNTPNYSEKTMKSSSKSDSSDTDTYEYRKTSSQNSLDMSRATNNNNLDMYLKSANNELEALEKLKKQYDPKTEQDKINNITKKQEALQNKAQKFVNQGYIKKGKKTSTKKGRKGKKGGSYSAKSLLVGSTSGTRSLLRNAKVTYKKRKK